MTICGAPPAGLPGRVHCAAHDLRRAAAIRRLSSTMWARRTCNRAKPHPHQANPPTSATRSGRTVRRSSRLPVGVHDDFVTATSQIPIRCCLQTLLVPQQWPEPRGHRPRPVDHLRHRHAAARRQHRCGQRGRCVQRVHDTVAAQPVTAISFEERRWPAAPARRNGRAAVRTSGPGRGPRVCSRASGVGCIVSQRTYIATHSMRSASVALRRSLSGLANGELLRRRCRIALPQ